MWHEYYQSNQSNVTWVGGQWNIYTPSNTGGLPNVNNNNYWHSGLGGADDLCKNRTEFVWDREQDGTAARQGNLLDYADLRPGDIIFFDWKLDGVVNHTLAIERVSAATAVGSYGNYNSLDQVAGIGNFNGIPDWNETDLLPITVVDVEDFLNSPRKLPSGGMGQRRDLIYAIKKFRGEQ